VKLRSLCTPIVSVGLIAPGLQGPNATPGKERLTDDRDRSFNLERFVIAQAPVFETVLAELRAGRKRSHWMWFVFPQLTGLGRSSTAKFYGIGSLDEARAYLAHPRLGPRLDLCTRIVLASENPSLPAIFAGLEGPSFISRTVPHHRTQTVRS